MQHDPYGEALLAAYHQSSIRPPLYLHTSYGDKDEIPVDVFFRTEEDFSELESIALALCDGHVLDVGALLVLCELDLERYALMDGMYMAAGISGRRMKGYSKKSMSSSRRMSGWASGNVRIFRKSVKDNQD